MTNCVQFLLGITVVPRESENNAYAKFWGAREAYSVFSLTWPASMQIYWNKRKRLHKKRVQLPQDWFGTQTWPPFHCFGTHIWPPWRHVKTQLWAMREWSMIKRSRLGTSLQTDKQQCTWNITYDSNNNQSCKKGVTSFRPRLTTVKTSDKTLMSQNSKGRRLPGEWYIITGLINHRFANNQQFNSFVVLFVIQKELWAFIQHLRVCVLIKILSYDLKGSKLLRWETQIQCFGDVTTLRKIEKKHKLLVN